MALHKAVPLLPTCQPEHLGTSLTGDGRARIPSQNDLVQSTETVFKIPDGPMLPCGPIRPSNGGSQGPSRSKHIQQRQSLGEAPVIRHARQPPNRTVEICTLLPPPDVIRRRNAQNRPNPGRWGGASGFSQGARHISMYNGDPNAQYLRQGHEV